MTATYNILVLTEHARHTASNSLYPLVQALRQNPHCRQIDVASRSVMANYTFFDSNQPEQLWVNTVDDDFIYSEDGQAFAAPHLCNPDEYDIIIMRLPHPVSMQFLEFLEQHFSSQVIVNRPAGIRTVADKAFLLQYPELCPPIQLCQNADEVRAFAQKFPIVLKPLRSYGGKGIVRIQEDEAEWDGQKMPLSTFLQSNELDYPYLGMKYLKNVTAGDKRIVLVNGQVIGASLRLPPPDSWLCNVSQGGTAHPTGLSPAEEEIVQKLAPVLIERGIVMAGLDTLTDDDGRRVLSEINALSVGGLHDLGNTHQHTAAERAAQYIWQYLLHHLTTSAR